MELAIKILHQELKITMALAGYVLVQALLYGFSLTASDAEILAIFRKAICPSSSLMVFWRGCNS